MINYINYRFKGNKWILKEKNINKMNKLSKNKNQSLINKFKGVLKVILY